MLYLRYRKHKEKEVMPNYVVNILRTKNETDFKTFSKLLIKDNEVDFDKLIHMPSAMNIESSSDSFVIAKHRTGYNESLRLSVLFKKLYKKSKTRDEFLDDILTSNSSVSGRKKEQLILKAQGFWNLVTYGSIDWYDWRIKHWGTKWNAEGTTIADGTITFTTAWSTCVPILEKLAQHINFTLVFADEDWGNNCGLIIAKDGKLVVDSNFGIDGGITNLEAQYIACLLWENEDEADSIEGISSERKAYILDCLTKYL